MTPRTLMFLAAALGVMAGAAGRWMLQPAKPGESGYPPPSAAAVPQKPSPASWRASVTLALSLPPGLRERAQVEWADAVPEEEIPEAIALLNPRRDFVQLQVLLCRWAARDPLAALAAWRGLPLPIELSSMTESTGSDWSGSGHNPRRKIGVAVLAAWSRRDPTAAGEWARTAKVDPEWSLVMGPYPLGQAVDRLPDQQGGRIATNPAAEGARALAMPVSDERTTILRNVLRAMVDKDPQAAAAWVESWPDETRRGMGVANLDWPLANAPASIRARLTGDQLRGLPPEKLAELLDRSRGDGLNVVDDGRYSLSALTFTFLAVREWTAEAPDQALAWVEAIEPPRLRGVLSGAVATAMLSRNDLTAAVAILDALPPDQQAAGLLPFIRGWAQADAPAAAAWLNRIEDAETRDSCLAAVAVSSSGSDPVWALTQSSGILDADTRSQMQRTIIDNQEARAPAVEAAWRERDPRAPPAAQ